MSRHPSPGADDLVLGTQEIAGARSPVPFFITPADQAYHGLLWGSTGTGKSKLLQSVFLQSVNKGRGVCLVDPHSDLALGCLSYLAAHGYFQRGDAFDKLVYVDFGQGGHLPFNVLAGRYEPHTTALNALETLVRTWPDLDTAPLFRTLFLSAALVLIQNHRPLTDINALLLDRDFRRQLLERVTDPLVLQTFAFYDRHGQGSAGSTLRRAFLLSFSPITRGILGQPDNLLDIRGMMDRGVSLIVNLGTIPDPVTRRLVGSLVMVQIEQAALSRTDQPQQYRRPWTCLVDEWPSFCATRADTLEHVLSQARKFNLRLWLAAQSLSQIPSERLSGAFENCRLSVTFRMGHDSARIQAKHLGEIDPYRVKQSARTATGRDQYMSTGEQLEEWVQAIIGLPPRHAYVKLHGKGTTAIRTLTVEEPQIQEGELAAVIAEYRRQYQRPAREVAALGQTSPPVAGDVPIGGPAASDILDIASYADAISTDTGIDFEQLFGDTAGGEAEG